MAKQIFTTEELELQDGMVITVRPLPIKPLRNFMKEFSKYDEEMTEDEGMDHMLEACLIALVHSNKDKEITKDHLEGVLDVPTMMRILEVAGGMDFNNPNLARAVAGRV